MKKIIIFTDIHVTGPDETIIGLDTFARFCTTRDAAFAAHPDADAAIIMGDLTHRGQPDAYRRLKNALAALPCPVTLMIGNHDDRLAFLATFSDAPQTPHGHVQSSHQIGEHQIITLDTLDAPPYPAGRHSGWLCPDRLAWLDAELAAVRDRQVIVCAHHPPFSTGIIGMDAIMMRNGTELLSRLAAHGQCHLMCGHLHRTVSGHSVGVPWTLFKSTGHQGPLDLVTADSSLSIDTPPGYGVVLLMDDGVVAHHVDLTERTDVHTEKQSGSSVATLADALQKNAS